MFVSKVTTLEINSKFHFSPGGVTPSFMHEVLCLSPALSPWRVVAWPLNKRAMYTTPIYYALATERSIGFFRKERLNSPWVTSFYLIALWAKLLNKMQIITNKNETYKHKNPLLFMNHL